MGTDAKRWILAIVSGGACLCCPAVIVVLGQKYGSGRMPNEDDIWLPSLAVDMLFWFAAFSTIAFIWSMPRYRWIGALIAVPLLALTAVLAVTNGLWIDGTYF
jgi:hypothetical protein